MNCIGPTARSNFASESYWPASVSLMTAVLLRAVERDAVDAGPGDALGVEVVAVGAAVVGLDAADRGDQLPGQVAGLVGGVDDGLGALVGGERGATGCREVEAVATACWVLPVMPGATRPGADTLAGASIASVGHAGAVRQAGGGGFSSAEAVVTPTPARLAVQATDSRASGTSAVAF